ncbi:hypothetical protein J14TS2_07660 [Bacillus sp. J14TS2]|nr:hypothetical protein J14TS2_07660 [Bacillus sp. J14TS2]
MIFFLKNELYTVLKRMIHKISYVFLRFILHVSGVLLILTIIFPTMLHDLDWLAFMPSFRIGDFSLKI